MSHESCKDAHAELRSQLAMAEETTDHYAAEAERYRKALEFILRESTNGTYVLIRMEAIAERARAALHGEKGEAPRE